MNTLPVELIEGIFNRMTLCSKRHWIQTSKLNNKFSSKMKFYEEEFVKMINNLDLCKEFYKVTFSKLSLHTLELLFDGMIESIPDRYITKSNAILNKYPYLYYNLAKRGNKKVVYFLLELGSQKFREHILRGIISNRDLDFLIAVYEKIKDQNLYLGNIYDEADHKIIIWIGEKSNLHNRYNNCTQTNRDDDLEYIINNRIVTYEGISYCIGKHNKIHLINKLKDDNTLCINSLTAGAASAGNVDILEVFDVNISYANKLYEKAAENGHINILEWLVKKGYDWWTNTSRVAAKNGHFNVLKWIKQMGHKFSVFTLSEAIERNNLKIVKWLSKNICKISSYNTFSLGSNNCIDMLQFCINNGYSNSSFFFLCKNAAYNGHLKLLEYIINNHPNIFYREAICSCAAFGGHLDLLKWLISIGCKIDHTTCYEAARRNNLEILQWLRSNGCEWNSETTRIAAECGHIDVLIWALDNGCEWEPVSQKVLIHYGRGDILKWLDDNGYEVYICSDTSESAEDI